MIVMIECLKRKAGTTKEQFREHYEGSHVMLAKKYIGHLFHDYQRDYVSSVITVKADGHDVSQTTDGIYDCITRITFENQAAVDEFFRIVSTPGIKELFEEDEKRFLDGRDLHLIFCETTRTWTAADLRAA